MKKAILFSLIILSCFYSFSQNIGIGTITPNPNAILDITSNSKGILIPRLDSTQRQVMPNVNGLLIYDSSTKSFWYNNGSSWINLAGQSKPAIGGIQYWNGTNWVNVSGGKPGQFLQYSVSDIPEWGGHTFAIVKTITVDNITQSTARSGDTSSSDLLSYLTGHGIVWDTLPNPNVLLSTKTNFPGTVSLGGSYQNLTDLLGNTTYYVRAYAINEAGFSYGNQIVFTTLPSTTPVLSTSAVINMKTTDTVTGPFTSITCGGNVSNTGGQPVTQRGVCWSTSPNPTVALTSKTNNGTGVGTFSSQVTNLACFTRYYIRSYATNSLGTDYGNEISFTTTYLGQSYYQNYVFSIDTSGMHGLMAMAYDLSYNVGAPWGCSNVLIGTNTAVGTGHANTLAILNACTTPGIAASMCNNVAPTGLYFLPSKDELALMYQRSQFIASFPTISTPGRYWSSSEASSINAWSNNSINNSPEAKTLNRAIRAIREF